jgi:protein ImuB
VRRIAAVHLPFLRIELARSSADSRGPLALVIARPGGAVKDERSLTGNTRLDEVCPEAHASGLRSGQTIASARARCAVLRVRVVTSEAVKSALERVAEALLAFGSATSFDLEHNLVWVDVTGCAHLHRTAADDSGEVALSSAIQKAVQSLSHVGSVAMADGPLVSAAVARFGCTGSGAPSIVPIGGGKAALAVLPIASLPLSGDAMSWLARLGLRTAGDLQKLPRPSLFTRLGACGASVMSLLDGDDGSPLAVYVPPSIPEETATLEYGIESTQALLFVLKGLSDRLGPRLAGRAMTATRLELVLGLDRALAPGEPRAVVSLSSSAPLTEASEIFGLLRVRIDSFAIEAPIVSATLRANELVPRTAKPRHLFVPEARAERALPRLVAELDAELGPGKVGVLTLANRWRLHERSRLVPLGSKPTVVPRRLSSLDSPAGSLLSGAPEPTRWATRPIRLTDTNGSSFRIHTRHELVEWWTRGDGSRHDHATAWIDWAQAVAWIEIDRRRNQVWIRGWVD